MINGDRLRELRKNNGLTQSKLGEVLGVTKASICCYEKGTRTPTVQNLIDLMEFFGVSADYLIGSDTIVNVKDKKRKALMTKEEVKFIELLRKNKYLSEILLDDPTRGIEILNKKIG